MDTDIVGFGLRVRQSGERTYVLKYRIGRQQIWFTIGRPGPLNKLALSAVIARRPRQADQPGG
jgi:Arm DNA-binding domain